MYLPSGRMIVSLISYCYLSSEQKECALRVMIWPCTFHQDWWWPIWSQLTLFHSESAVVSICNVILFLTSCQVPCMVIVAHQMNLFLFLLFLIFFVNFLWWSQTFECDICCFPVRIWNAVYFCKTIWAPMMKFMVTKFCTLLVWSKSLSVKEFVVGHSWACGLRIPGQGKMFLTVFHWRSVNTTFDVSWRYIRDDFGITFSASAALPMMRLTL